MCKKLCQSNSNALKSLILSIPVQKREQYISKISEKIIETLSGSFDIKDDQDFNDFCREKEAEVYDELLKLGGL